jgi:hypothetical protein
MTSSRGSSLQEPFPGLRGLEVASGQADSARGRVGVLAGLNEPPFLHPPRRYIHGPARKSAARPVYKLEPVQLPVFDEQPQDFLLLGRKLEVVRHVRPVRA